VAELLGYDYQAYQYKAAAAIPLGTADEAAAQLAVRRAQPAAANISNTTGTMTAETTLTPE
jgi:hypothetical protein